MAGARTAALALALLALGAPSAAAQFLQPGLVLETEFPSDPLVPLVDHPGFPTRDEVRVRVPVNLTYTVPAGSAHPRPTLVRIEPAETPVWLGVSFVPSDLVFEPGPVPALGPRTYRASVEMILSARGTAPAHTPAEVVVRAVAEPNGGLGAPVEALARGRVSASGYTILNASAVNATPSVPRFGEVTIEIAVANLGNELALAKVEVAHADRGLAVRTRPPPVVLRPNPLGFQLDRETRLVPVTIVHESGHGGEMLLLVTDALETDGILQERVVRLHVAVEDGRPTATVLWPLALLAAAGALVAVSRGPRKKDGG